MTRQRKHQLKNVAAGMCKNHTTKPIAAADMCRECADKWNAYKRAKRKTKKV